MGDEKLDLVITPTKVCRGFGRHVKWACPPYPSGMADFPAGMDHIRIQVNKGRSTEVQVYTKDNADQFDSGAHFEVKTAFPGESGTAASKGGEQTYTWTITDPTAQPVTEKKEELAAV